MDIPPLLPFLAKALAAREPLLDPARRSAFRLFNGFTEGCPSLSIDLYGSTLVLFDHSADRAVGQALVGQAVDFIQNHPLLTGVRAVLVKRRDGGTQEEKRGQLLFGTRPDDRITEHGVRYALDLTMNRDASFYLDTRGLRRWIIENARGKRVLNAFAYTGSLGVAALAGGAGRVLQLDLNRRFLNLAKTSCTLNGFPIRKADFVAVDFFPQVAHLKRLGERFDLVLIDPPFFSATSRGRVDQVNESARLINKVRPLIADGGLLVAVNNALFVSGGAYTHTLESLCADGYMHLRERIQIPEDVTGFASTRVTAPITDPSPFNHSTKIAVLEIRCKDAKESE